MTQEVDPTKQIRTQMGNPEKELLQGTTPTPFSIFGYHLSGGDDEAAMAQLTEDIEWDLMPNGQMYKGKEQVSQFCKAGWKGANKRTPEVINDVAGSDWGVFEYWNRATIAEGSTEFARVAKLPFPGDIRSALGHEFKVAVCFVYHFNEQGKIDLIREYTDMGSIMAQISGNS